MNISDLTQKDIGKWVFYDTYGEKEIGKIKSYNDKWIFVVYHCADNWDDYTNYTAAATNASQLTFCEEEDIINFMEQLK